MRFSDILEGRKKKVVPPAIPYNPGWDNLNWFKERAKERGDQLANTLQLFMPRPNPHAMTNRDRRLQNLSNKYAYDDEGTLKPEYEKWELGIHEAAPTFTPGKSSPVPGGNKPIAKLWTSTAKQLPNGAWTSDWVRWVSGNQNDWMSKTGSLYRVKPGALALQLDSDQDARQLLHAFQDLGRYTQPTDNAYSSDGWDLRRAFPWEQVVKHFDAVSHYGFRWDGNFMYGWDCESTAWLDTSFLELVGEVQIGTKSDDDD